MSRPLIALLSDFGTADHYVGTMKGVMLGICPEAALVDITHDVPPHDVRTGARQLAASYKYFPAGTVFLAVVDPGVGSSRRGIAVETVDHRFVAPDNGLLSAVLDEAPARRVVELTERKFALRDDQPDLRRAGSLRPGRGLAGQGRGHHHHGAQRRRPGPPGVAGGRRTSPTGSKAQSRSSIASATSSPTWDAMPSNGWYAPAGSTSRSPATRCRDWSPPTPTSPRETCARSSEAATISRLPSAAAAPRRPSASVSAPRSG